MLRPRSAADKGPPIVDRLERPGHDPFVTIRAHLATILGAAIGAPATCAVALVLAAGADAGVDGASTIEPRTRVNGMLVVQGSSRRSETSLFGVYCDPIVLTPGRRSRECGRVPAFSRIYVGYGLFAPKAIFERTWKGTTWAMWLDGQRVDLRAFGTSDRVLPKFAPAGNKDVVLREWSIVLVDPTPGRHKIRYRTADKDGVQDTTWTFTIRTG
jgi:hypothetical protein